MICTRGQGGLHAEAGRHGECLGVARHNSPELHAIALVDDLAAVLTSATVATITPSSAVLSACFARYGAAHPVIGVAVITLGHWAIEAYWIRLGATARLAYPTGPLELRTLTGAFIVATGDLPDTTMGIRNLDQRTSAIAVTIAVKRTVCTKTIWYARFARLTFYARAGVALADIDLHVIDGEFGCWQAFDRGVDVCAGVRPAGIEALAAATAKGLGFAQ